MTIRGTGFNSNCGNVSPCTITPPLVFFGSAVADSEMINDTLIIATTPKQLPGSVEVSVQQRDGIAYAQQRFTFEGDRPSTLERILLPIFTGPVRGAFGSEFHTKLRAFNNADTELIEIIGLLRNCPTCLPRALDTPWVLSPYDPDITATDALPRGKPGMFIYVKKEDARHLEVNLRVQDVTRDAQNFGTEIPVVRERHWFLHRRIALVGVPTDPRFRNTLRIYSTNVTVVDVQIGDEPTREVILQPGDDAFQPAYAVVSDFPVSAGTIRVLITPRESAPPLWAFISVTNNDTQMITTVTP